MKQEKQLYQVRAILEITFEGYEENPASVEDSVQYIAENLDDTYTENGIDCEVKDINIQVLD